MLADHRLILPDLKQVGESMNHHKLHRVFFQVSFFQGSRNVGWISAAPGFGILKLNSAPAVWMGTQDLLLGLDWVDVDLGCWWRYTSKPNRNLRKPLSAEVPIHFYHVFSGWCFVWWFTIGIMWRMEDDEVHSFLHVYWWLFWFWAWTPEHHQAADLLWPNEIQKQQHSQQLV